jgi:xanthine phosphoribosyltransferase
MSLPPQKFFPVSWDELHRHGKALAWRLIELGPWQGVIAVTRGGMVPAAIVARELDIRMIETACIIGYRPEPKSGTLPEAEILKMPQLKGDGAGWLVIDDLVDTGRTAEILRQHYPKAHFATIYAKPQGRPQVDTFITEVSQDTWIYFPWDIEPRFAQPIATQNKDSKFSV